MSERAEDEGSTETAVAGGEDFIGALPDDVLRYLLSFLPSLNAVRTCVLAKRWRTLWKSVPALRIKDNEYPSGSDVDEDDDVDLSGWDDDMVDELQYNGSIVTFVHELLRLRDPTPLNVCEIISKYGYVLWNSDEDDEEAFGRIEPWIRYALSHEVRVLRVDAATLTTNLAPVSSHLKRVELTSMRFHGSLDFLSCPVLDVLELSSCSISANILSQSLRHLYIEDGEFGRDIRSRISAPNLLSLKLDQDIGWPPLLDSMPLLVTASVRESTDFEEDGEDSMSSLETPSDGESADYEQHAEESFSVVLEGLSSATNLKLLTPRYQNSIFRMDLKWCPMFSSLKTLLLSDWCLADNFTGMVYFLQHSPILEKLTLQLDFQKNEKYQLLRDERNKSMEQGYNPMEHDYNSSNQSLLSKHLKVVKIICGKKQDVTVQRILKILCTHGVPSEKIDIQ